MVAGAQRFIGITPPGRCAVRIFLLALAFLAGVGGDVIAQPAHVWSRGLRATTTPTHTGNLRISALAVGPTNGFVIVGTFSGALDLGGAPLVSSDSDDLFIASFDDRGDHLWSKSFPTTGTSATEARSVAVGPAGEVVIAGELGGTVDFGGWPLSSPSVSAFLARFGADGAHHWSRQFGTGFGAYAEGVVVDRAGFIILTGSALGPIDFGPGPLPAGSFDAFVAKFGPDGGHAWSWRFYFGGIQLGKRVAVDNDGNVCLAGSFYDEIFSGPMRLMANGEATFVAQFTPEGNPSWSRKIWGQHAVASISFAGPGRPVVVGDFVNAVIFGEDFLAGSPGDADGFVAVFDGPRLESSTRFGGTGAQSVSTVAVDLLGNIFVAGSFSGTLQFGRERLTSVGDRDVFLASLDPLGAPAWSLGFAGAGTSAATAVATGAGGDLLLTGSFSESIDFDGGVLTGGGYYLAKLGGVRLPPPELAISLIRRERALEARWYIDSEQPLETMSIFRTDADAPEAELVFEGPAGEQTGVFVDHDVTPGRKYHYQLVVRTVAGREYRSAIATAVPVAPAFADALAQNAPNPFNPTTSISYSVSEASYVVIEIYDVSGVHVRNLVEGSRDAGEYVVDWDGRDDAGRAAGSGVYFYRLDGVAGVAPRKMVLLK